MGHDCDYAFCRFGQLPHDYHRRCGTCATAKGGRVVVMWVIRPAWNNPLRMWEEICWVPTTGQGVLL